MIDTPPARQTTLFDLPPVQIGAASARAPRTPMAQATAAQAQLWLNIDVQPSPGRLSPAAREYRTQLHDAFDADAVVWDRRMHDRGLLLLPLLRRITYTREMVYQAWRVYLEYRDRDKTPHYRVMWGELLWGRLNIRTDTNINGADILTCSTLPLIQDRLAAYLMALGFRIESVRLQPHVVEIDTEQPGDDLLKKNVRPAREYRLFALDADARRRIRRKNKKSQKDHHGTLEREGSISA